MEGVIYYYSGMGNTELACQCIARRMAIPFELVDATNASDVELDQADVVGFVASTDFWGVPQVLKMFIDGLLRQAGKPTFVRRVLRDLHRGVPGEDPTTRVRRSH